MSLSIRPRPLDRIEVVRNGSGRSDAATLCGLISAGVLRLALVIRG